MFYRAALQELNFWKLSADRKPLVLRGARQVGKTTLVGMFATSFEQYIYLNFDKPADRAIFDNDKPFAEKLESLFYLKNKDRNKLSTLIFIDEIQNVPRAVAGLRYFYEEFPGYFVIAAGSLLESLIDRSISFPVGRVEYLAVRPVSFHEFLMAAGEEKSLEFLHQGTIPDYAHLKISSLFKIYTLIGGMPGIVKLYLEKKDPGILKKNFDGLLVSFVDDVEKYGKNNSMIRVLQFVLKNVFFHFSQRITFERFAQSPYRSREIGEAFRLLEKTMLLQLVYPTEQAVFPAIPNIRKSPKLQLLDTGMVNAYTGFQKSVYLADDISSVYLGKIAEHIVGQELLSGDFSVMARLHFWTSEKRNSQAEIDFLYKHDDKMVPIEVKSGSAGKLKSLHQFMDKVPHRMAIRLWSAPRYEEKLKTPSGKEFVLLNLPHYYAAGIKTIIDEYAQFL